MPTRLARQAAPLAAIDIGSHSFRLEIARVTNAGYRPLLGLKETVRLGAGLDAQGHIDNAAIGRGLAALDGFARHLRGMAPWQVRAVATQTLRESSNRDDFLRRAQGVLGFPIEVISGREEARLIYAGVACLQPSATPRLVIDIGGRSTEMILGLDDQPTAAESFKVGSVGLTARFFADGRLGADAFRAAQIAAGAELEEALQPFGPSHWREALGSSGTTGAVSEVLAALGRTDGRITPEGLRWLIRQCIAAGHVERLQWPRLDAERRGFIGGALALLYTLLAQFQIGELRAVRGALRQGVIVDLSQRLGAGPQRGGDLRSRTVRELQARFDVDLEQARRVRQVATALFGAAAAEAPETDPLRELQWACDLHEAGLMVSHHDHHRHGAYLVTQVDAPGFSLSQQERVAELVLGQRGSLRKLARVTQDPAFAWQVLALRLACIASHARNAALPSGTLRLRRKGRIALLELGARWAARNPRTVHLLHEEVEAWARQPGSLGLALKTA